MLILISVQWTIDYLTGRMTAQWINPDGSKRSLVGKISLDCGPAGSPATYLVSDGVRVAATGDIAAFNAANGQGWFAVVSTLTALNKAWR